MNGCPSSSRATAALRPEPHAAIAFGHHDAQMSGWVPPLAERHTPFHKSRGVLARRSSKRTVSSSASRVPVPTRSESSSPSLHPAAGTPVGRQTLGCCAVPSGALPAACAAVVPSGTTRPSLRSAIALLSTWLEVQQFITVSQASASRVTIHLCHGCTRATGRSVRWSAPPRTDLILENE